MRAVSFLGLFTMDRCVWQSLGLSAVLILSALGDAAKVSACPAYLYFRSDLKSLVGKRKDLKLLTYSRRRKLWTAQPIQVDPLNAGGGVIFLDGTSKWMEDDIDPNDRVVFSVDEFGDQASLSQLPCKGSTVYRLTNYLQRNKVAYLTVCNSDKIVKERNIPGVRYDVENSTLESWKYSYRFNKENYLLFDQVYINNDGKTELSSLNSDISIYSDVRNFFSLKFDSENIESKLERTLEGPLGINGSLSFFVRALLLKVRLALSTDVSFYSDSAHIPMVLFLPVDANSYLHSGSGIIYHWQLSKQVRARGKAEVKMPVFDQSMFNHLSNDVNAYNSRGMNYCQGKKYCYFSYKVGGKDPFVMQFTIVKSLVQSGFYPVYVPDVDEFDDLMGWSLNENEKSSGNRFGFYFSTGSLTQGNHAWDFWMQLGKNEQKNLNCPYPLILDKIYSRRK